MSARGRTHHKRRRRRRQLRSIVFASAAMLTPQTGKAVPKAPLPASVSQPDPIADRPPAEATVAVAVEFRLASSAFDHLIAEAGTRYGLDPALIRAVIRAESGFDPRAVSSAGALGLMQLMPDLAEEMGVADPFDPRQNIMAGTSYLARLLQDHGGDLALALASYNAGPAVVAQYQGIPPFPETQHYVQSITSRLALPPAPDDHEP